MLNILVFRMVLLNPLVPIGLLLENLMSKALLGLMG